MSAQDLPPEDDPTVSDSSPDEEETVETPELPADDVAVSVGSQTEDIACSVVSPAPSDEPSGSSGDRTGGAADALENHLAALCDEVKQVRDELTALQQQTGKVAHLTAQVAQTQKLGAEQLRRFKGQVEQATSAVADARFRQLAEGLLLYYDLLAGMTANADSHSPDATPDGYRMLLRQLCQLMQINGIEEIPAEGSPDYKVHRAVKIVPPEPPQENNSIVEVWRAGFHIGERVLRPAEVVVALENPPTASSDDAADVAEEEAPCESDTATRQATGEVESAARLDGSS